MPHPPLSHTQTHTHAHTQTHTHTRARAHAQANTTVLNANMAQNPFGCYFRKETDKLWFNTNG